MTGLEWIALKRKEQIEKHNFTSEHDDKHNKGQLLMLAHYCILSNNDNMPKDETWRKDYLSSFFLLPRIEQLAIAGALIAAEIDRRQRENERLIEKQRQQENE
jgi:hypothetical protein